MGKLRVKQKFYLAKQSGRFNFNFFNFYDLSKIRQNWRFLRFLAFLVIFSETLRLYISKTVHPTKKVSWPLLKQNFERNPKMSSKTLYDQQKKSYGRFHFLFLTSICPQTGQKKKKCTSEFVQNFLPNTIKMRPKLSQNLLECCEHFPVYNIYYMPFGYLCLI